MRTILFTPAARCELTEAHDWYEHELPGLGDEFLEQIEAVLLRMRTNPMQFPSVYRSARRALLQRFPYALIFVVERDDTLSVISCWHSSRDPMRWQQRVM